MAKKTAAVAVVEKFAAVGSFVDEAAFKKHVKPLTDEEVAEWVAKEGLTVKDYNSAPINRMRQLMAIKNLHFPPVAKEPKSKSKYADFSNEQLVQMAIDNEILFEACEDERILRMRAIMALRAHNIIE